jgi:hypothetical protein
LSSHNDVKEDKYDFASHIVTDDTTPSEVKDLEDFLDEIILDVDNIDGTSLTITQQDSEAKAAEEMKRIEARMEEQYDPANDPEIDQPPVRKPRIRFDRDHLKQLVAQCDLLNFPRDEACKFINKVLNPDDDPTIPVFTKPMYTTWLTKLKGEKIQFFQYYSRSGIYEDVYDVRATLKMVYQNLARQFKLELMKGKEKDKRYIIKIAEIITMMSDEMMRVAMSSPFISGFQNLIEYQNRIIDEVKRVDPHILKKLGIKPFSAELSLPAAIESATDGQPSNETVGNTTTILVQPSEEKEGTGTGEGDIQKSPESRGLQESNGTTGSRTSERIFG